MATNLQAGASCAAARQRARVATLLHTLLGSAEIDPDAQVGSLPIATRQLVEVAKALNRAHVKLLILDEPTAALTETEAQVIFDRLRKLRGQGLHIIYITHRLAEVFEIADRVTVLRDGKVALAGQQVANLDPGGGGHSDRRRAGGTSGARGRSSPSPRCSRSKALSGTRFGPIDLAGRCWRSRRVVRRPGVGADRIAGNDIRIPQADQRPRAGERPRSRSA